MTASPPPIRSQLILGTAVGFRYDQVAPFLVSLAQSGYQGDTVLFADRDLARELRLRAPLPNLIAAPARQWLPFRWGFWERRRLMAWVWTPIQTALWWALRLAASLGITRRARGQRLQAALACALYSPMDSRFVRYEQFLRLHPYSRVLLTDVRDVVFQADPFTQLPSTGLATGLETAAYRISTEPHNAEWLRRTYGSDALALIGGERVSCVGVTYGDREAIGTYLRRVTEELMRLRPTAISVGGADTAIHNKLVWSDDLGPVALLEPLESAIVHLNAIDEAELRTDAEGRLLNRDGRVISVVHQYDRHARLRGMYAEAVASSTLDSELRGESHEP